MRGCALVIGLAGGLASAGSRSAPVALPVSFEPNLGQTDARVKFLARGNGATLWLTEQGAVVAAGPQVFRMRFERSNRAPEIRAEDTRPGRSNYLHGSDPKQWQVDVPQFGKVRYRQVYPGIDVVFHGDPQKLEYDFVLAPGADPSRIRLAFDGVDRLRIDDAGNLVLKTRRGDIVHRKPVLFQNNRPVGGHYVLRGRRSAGFAVDPYDRSRPLVIDPVLTYASMLGGSDGDQAYAVAIDSQGMVYIGGQTASSNFPVKNALYPIGANLVPTPFPQAWIAKFNPAASGEASLVYSTYISGAEPAEVYSLAVDKSGNLVVVGYTDSSPSDGFPVVNAFQPTFPNSNSCIATGSTIIGTCYVPFVLKLNAAGNGLVYSSYFGGGSGDLGNAVALDAAGNAYLAGYSVSQGLEFPFWGNIAPYQSELHQSQNGLLMVVSPQGALLYGTYFGGGQNTTFTSVAVDSSGLVYLGGNTSYTGLPTTSGALQSKYSAGNLSGFVAIFDFNANLPTPLQYCTYLGGLIDAQGYGRTQINGVATDNAGNVYVAGETVTSDFPTTANAAFPQFQGWYGLEQPNQGDAFLAKLNPSLQGQAQLVYSTFYGGSGDDGALALAVDSSGRATIVGVTDSHDFPVTPDAFQCCYDGTFNPSKGSFTTYGFLVRIDPSKSGSSSVVYSTLLGGQFTTPIQAIAEDPPGDTVAVAGWFEFAVPVTLTAYQSIFGGNGSPALSDDFGDAYVATFNMATEGPIITAIENSGALSQGPSPPTMSPGMLFTIKGNFPGPSSPASLELDSNGLVTTTNSGIRVLVNGVPAPLIYVSNTVINAIAPYEISSLVGSTVRVQVIYNGGYGTLMPIQVAATAPGILNYDDGSGQIVAGNADGTLNGSSNPAPIGSTIVFFATGEGQTSPAGVDGLPATNFSNLPKPNGAVSVTIGGVSVTPVYAGAEPDAVAGVMQVNVTIPAGVTPGPAVPIVLTVGNASSPKTTTIAVSAQ